MTVSIFVWKTWITWNSNKKLCILRQQGLHKDKKLKFI